MPDQCPGAINILKHILLWSGYTWYAGWCYSTASSSLMPAPGVSGLSIGSTSTPGSSWRHSWPSAPAPSYSSSWSPSGSSRAGHWDSVRGETWQVPNSPWWFRVPNLSIYWKLIEVQRKSNKRILLCYVRSSSEILNFSIFPCWYLLFDKQTCFFLLSVSKGRSWQCGARRVRALWYN